jgi:hypothetical protein
VTPQPHVILTPANKVRTKVFSEMPVHDVTINMTAEKMQDSPLAVCYSSFVRKIMEAVSAIQRSGTEILVERMNGNSTVDNQFKLILNQSSLMFAHSLFLSYLIEDGIVTILMGYNDDGIYKSTASYDDSDSMFDNVVDQIKEWVKEHVEWVEQESSGCTLPD